MEPRYEKDDGPLTDNQLAAIREASPATNTPDVNFTWRLFPEHKPNAMPEDANLPPYED